MKLIIIILSLFLLSCTSSTQRDNKLYRTIIKVEDAELTTYVIDSCEYIGDLNGCHESYFLTHKGNCKFCQKR